MENKYKKLVIIGIGNYNQRFSDMCGVPELLRSGVCVEYWDVAELVIPSYKVHPSPIPTGLVTYNVCDDYRLNELICFNNNDTIYQVQLTYALFSFKIYRYLTKKKCHILFFINGCLPVIPSEQRSLGVKLISLSNKNLSEIKKMVKSKLQDYFLKLGPKLKIIAPCEIVIKSCGVASEREGCVVGSKTKYFLANSSDYESTLNYKGSTELSNEKYAVFLDQNIPFHPDNVLVGAHFDANNYFDQMNSILEKVEKKYGMKVIIAAHPSCLDTYVKNDYFHGRMVMIGRTMELVKNATLVLSHDSTAISFPVIYKKPILLIVTNEMKSARIVSFFMCKEFSRILGCPLVESEKEIDSLDKIHVDGEAYEKYMYSYLTNPQTERVQNSELYKKILSC